MIVWTRPAQEERFSWGSSRRLIKELYIRTAERFLISFDFFGLVFTFSVFVFNFPLYQRLGGRGHAHTRCSVCVCERREAICTSVDVTN